MKRSSIKALALSGLLAQPLLLACGTDDGGNDMPSGTNTGVGPGAPVSPVPAGQCLTQTGPDGNLLLVASEANNYSLVNHLDVQSTAIKPKANLTIDWSGLTVDMFKHPIAAGELDRVSVVQWNLTHQQVMDSLAKDELGNSGALVLGLEHVIVGAETTVPVSQMKLPYSDSQPSATEIAEFLDPAKWSPEAYSYTVTVNTGDFLKSGARMIQHAHVDPASTNEVITVTNESTVVTVQVEMDSVPPVMIPAGNSAITVDWSKMTTNALAQPFQKQTIAEVRVMHFPFSATELEGKFLDLEQIADVSYVGMVTAGETFSLAQTVDAQNVPFTGIDPARGGTWVVALLCLEGLCGNPAPWYMARLEACAAPM